MDRHENIHQTALHRTLPPGRRLLLVAVLLPAAVALSNQLLVQLALASAIWLRSWLYPWMVLTTAALSWCVGRYLSPAWLRWFVFAWALTLLDALTIAACLGGPMDDHFAYALVSTQISLLVLWTILSPLGWQWRLPGLLAAAPIVIVFAGSFSTGWGSYARDWEVLMLLTAAGMFLLCGSLRLFGFSLQRVNAAEIAGEAQVEIRAHQFGLKHMLAWATAMVPMLLVFRGLDFFVLSRLGAHGTFTLALVALSIATVNLIAIWAVLGRGSWFGRVATLLVVPLFLAVGTIRWMTYVESMFQTRWQALNRTDDTLLGEIVDVRETWLTWLWLNAALLAALLLFLRAGGYWLMRRTD